MVDYSYCATFAIDDESVNPMDRLSIFDKSRRVWLDGKLVYYKVLQDWIKTMIAHYLLLLLLTKRPIVAPTLDDIICKDCDYSKAIPKQNNYRDIDVTSKIFWLDK